MDEIIKMEVGKVKEVKKTKGNLVIYGGRFGRIFLNVFRNVNKRNVAYFRVNFSMSLGNNRYANLPVGASELANLQAALDAARKWLRDK